VLVERQIQPGIELILGARMSDFGPLALVGAGGILAEFVRDTRVELAPLDSARASSALQATRAGQLLTGYRNAPARDATAATAAFVQISRLVVDLEAAIGEVEINPLVVQAQGVVALDAVVRGRA
jgi:succinyl-CoA synthetase beta subunit